MYTRNYILVLASVASIASAIVYEDGPCPKVEPMNNFNLTGFTTGFWYQVAKYAHDFENGGDCATFFFKTVNGRIIEVADESLSNQDEIIEGTIDFALDANGQGKLVYKTVSLKGDEKDGTLPMNVLIMKYDNYGIVYDCVYDKTTNKRHDYVWIVSRTSKLTDEAKAAIDSFISNSKIIDPAKLFWDKFDDESCKGKKYPS